MIHSSLFSSGDSSVWDPKVIRKHLHISEDQLNALSNLPGWSKVSDHTNTLRLEKEITIVESSQSSQFHLVTTQNSLTNNQNIKLFDDILLSQASIVKPHKVSRSVSLCEIDKISESLPENKSLKRVVSLPLLCKSSSNSCLSSDSETAIREKYSSINSELTSQILPGVATLEQKHTDSSKLGSVIKDTLGKMSVVSLITENSNSMKEQLQVVQNGSCDIEIVSNNESRVQLVEKMNLTPVLQSAEILGNLRKHPENISNNIEKVSNGSVVEVVEKMNVISENSSNVNNLPTAIVSSIVSVSNSKSTVPDKDSCNAVDSSENKLGSCIVEETAPDTAKEKMNFNSETLTEISETRTEILESVNSVPKKHPTSISNLDKPIDSESSEDKLGSCIIKETTSADINSTANAVANDKMDSYSGKITEIHETSTDDLQSFNSVNKGQPTGVKNLLPNIQGNPDLLNTRMEILIDPKISQDVTLVTNAEKRVVPEKRKSSSKNKSSKRRKSNRERPESVDVRSLKRAGDIRFTDEDIRDMINIIKCFL